MTLFPYNSHLYSRRLCLHDANRAKSETINIRKHWVVSHKVQARPARECQSVEMGKAESARSDPATPDQYGIEHLFVVLFARRRYWWTRVSAALSHAAASYYPQCFVSIGRVYPTIDPRVPGDSLKTFRRKYSKRSRVATGNGVSRYLAIISR